MKLLKLICILGMCLLIPQGMFVLSPSVTFVAGSPQPIKILIVESPSITEASRVEERFRQNAPSFLVAPRNVQFTPLAEPSIEASISAASERLETEVFDLILIPRSFVFGVGFPSFLQPDFGELLLPLIRTLEKEVVALINGGFVDVAVEGFVVGVELPWDASHVLAVPDTTTRFHEVIAFLQAMVKNISTFFLEEQDITVKVLTLRFENDTDKPAYDIHIEYDRLVTDADPDRNTWTCNVDGAIVKCETRDDAVAPWNSNLMRGGRLSIGAAFIGEAGSYDRCWWTGADGGKISLRC